MDAFDNADCQQINQQDIQDSSQNDEDVLHQPEISISTSSNNTVVMSDSKNHENNTAGISFIV